MNLKMKLAAAVILPLSAPAFAQSALSQLKLEAGDEAVTASAAMIPLLSDVRTVDAVQVQTAARPQADAETAAKLQAEFRQLQGTGFKGLEWGPMPLGVRYISVPLQLMTCPGCASYTALVPVGVLAPSAPAQDPNKASYFILERSADLIPPTARYSKPIAMPQDVLAPCGDVDALTIRAWSLPEAVRHTQACLDKTYNQHPTARKIYFVNAEAGRFGVRVCPESTGPRCQAIMEVLGVKVVVAGRVPATDSTVASLRHSLDKRHGKLYGFYAIVDDSKVIR